METKIFVMDKDALVAVPEVLKRYFPDCRPFLVADENTWRAAGIKLSEILNKQQYLCHKPFVFPGSPRLHPDNRYADLLASLFSSDCVPVAVGSGVINDLVKRAAGLAEIPYCCVPTAASVDGYTSYGAALVVDGRKKTLPCPAPLAIVADLTILENAPAEMLSSGYADLVTKVPAGADWLIVDALGMEPIDQKVWKLVQQDLRSWISDHKNLHNVFMGLAATGYAMQMYRESRPASGAEHLMSHIWEMEGLTHNGEDVSHGYKVGIGTLASTLLMEFVIETDVESARELAEPAVSASQREAEIDRLLIRNCYGPDTRSIAMDKFLEGEALRQKRELIWNVWELLRVKLKEQLIPYNELVGMLARANCPTRPAEIGLTREEFIHGVVTAQLIRKRYTILDFLYESGLLRIACKKLDRMS